MKKIFLSSLCRRLTTCCLLTILLLLLFSCEDLHRYDPYAGQSLPVTTEQTILQLDSTGWWWENNAPVDLSKAAFSVQTDTMRLHFFGWSLEEDSVFHVTFPATTDTYGRAILSYTMCGWNQGPAEWDMTTQIMVEDKESGQWYEISRCITPYGGSFGPNWDTVFHIDVTEFLPILKGDTRFKIFYCGWDATAKRAHATSLRFSFFSGNCLYGTPTVHQKIYDSTLPNAGSNGYRAWSYGVDGFSIEDSTRLCPTSIHIPAGTTHALLRVCITGHGQDAYNGSGYFVINGQKKYAQSAAEFDKNQYTITLNGDTIAQKGLIWELNKSGYNYKQSGTWTYSRAGWGPGKPANVQHWLITNIPPEGQELTLDFSLYEYHSPCAEPNHDQVACYYVEADLFGYAR